MKRLLMTTAAGVLAASFAYADTMTDSIVSNLQSLGYDAIELKVGPTQIKAEAIKDGVKREIVYDRTSGKVLKDESEAAEADDDISPGVDIENEDDDFLGDDSDDDDDSADVDDDSDDDDNSGSGSDDSGDDSDDDHDDDNGGNSGSGGSGGGNSGSGGNDDDD